MAQTKRKRQTKHRGNAAGVIEARGRTGRPPSAEERKRSERDRRREERIYRKPTWRQSAQRAALAGIFVFVIQLFVFQNKKNSLAAAAFTSVMAVLLYLGIGYYMELFLWRRRMAKRHAAPPRR
jgi:hypothetical protein